MLLADWIASLIPAVIGSVLVLAFEEIMERDQVPNFLVTYAFYGCALNVFCYLFAHLFSNPDTGSKYMSLLFIIGLLAAPFGISAIIAVIGGGEQDYEATMGFWYFFSPLITFTITV